MPIKTKLLGYPRIGAKRELKKATEAYWKGETTLEALEQTGRQIRQENWLKQQQAGVDFIPSNDFSFYDQMLDMSCLLGNVPERFHWDGQAVDLDMMFFMARGLRPGAAQAPTTACEMTKWFDTNYHYIVPEFMSSTRFKLSSSKVLDEFQQALELGITTVPVLIGPMTYLLLGKTQGTRFDVLALLDHLLPVYEQVLQRLVTQGAVWVQMDEPILATDLTALQRNVLVGIYQRLSRVTGIKIMVASYFGPLQDNLKAFLRLPVAGLHMDALRAGDEVLAVARGMAEGQALSVGIVDGRNIWKNDYAVSLKLLQSVREVLSNERLMVSTSCSLLHVPLSLVNEVKLDVELRNWMAFAQEKLGEIKNLADLLDGHAGKEVLATNQAALAVRRNSRRIHDEQVAQQLSTVTPKDLNRRSPFIQRRALHQAHLGLPLFPTTTIGSFPQTSEVRTMRRKHKDGQITPEQYERFLEEQIQQAVAFQQDIGLDVLVHGEFERNDMVEYFGQQLAGFVFTAGGWVQSYGSRYVKPPIIFGDVSRPKPMTVRWSAFARSLTEKPMKGMLTGPVTILQWSFVRNDQPRSATARQIALAIRDEVLDLEAAGIAAIQIDEPALREGLPLRRQEWSAYLDWAVDAFRLSSASVRDATQIHTHMCYAQFNDIIEAIARMDADVISIETARSNMELLGAFEQFQYPNDIGPGVYDIHSPRVPSIEEMLELLAKAGRVLPAEHIWVNPDCGLKTRGWPEVKAALKNMVEAAKAMRQRLS